MSLQSEEERRFLIETNDRGQHFKKGLFVQPEAYAGHSRRQFRHKSLADLLGMVDPVGGICVVLGSDTLSSFVRASSSVPGANEEQMWEAYRQSGIHLISKDVISSR